MAQSLAEAVGADLFEIKPEVPYTKADLDWQDKNSRSSVEMKDKSSRPAIAKGDAKIEEYDLIFLGFPIWWYVAPTIVNTFLESYDFAGKTIILFATSGSSGLGDTANALKGSVDSTTVIKDGKILNGNPSVNDLKEWISILDL